MEITVRKTNHVDGVSKISEQLSEYFDEKGKKKIQEDVRNHLLYGAYEGDEMVGFVMYKPVNEQTVEMSWLGVLLDKQGVGVGTTLVEESLQEVGITYKVCEVKTLSEVDSYEPYKKTRGFYKKLGFIPIETIYPYPNWDDPCQIFVKFLNVTT